MAAEIGQSFGNFRIVRLLGEGGFGEVYEAENPFLQRRAAVKVLHTGLHDDQDLVRRFLNEARAASAIRHPNIIEVFDAGITPQGEPYILMEFLEGDSLQKLMLQEGRMQLPMVQEIARQAGSALAAAHASGIVHRDLKPENVFLVPDPTVPPGFRVKVLDFGIAKIKQRDGQGSTLKTQAGLLMGSPAYMSPEQCRDSSDVDLRSDIYSLAIIVYEMLAGAPPFTSQSPTEMLVMQIAAEPPPLGQHASDLPVHVERTVMRALAKNRESRYASMDYFVGALLGTYPAETAQGSVATTGCGGESPVGQGIFSTLSYGQQPTPAPVQVDDRMSRANLTPVPVGRTTITTFSHAKGEASPSPSGSSAEFEIESMRTRRWPAVAVLGALAAAAVLVMVLRSRPPAVPAPVATTPAVPVPAPVPDVRVQIRSAPGGATVLDEGAGIVLGMTPLEKTYPRGAGTMQITLRLAGHKDKTVPIGLDANSSTSVDLEPVETLPAEVERKPAAKPAPPRKAAPARRPPQPRHDEEEEWRVH